MPLMATRNGALRLASFLVVTLGCVTLASAASDCVCATNYAPVCGEGGTTFSNACEAACAGVKVAYPGKCADPSGCAAVMCISLYDPVCGANNVTYSNDCMASCTGVTIVAKGECGAAGPGSQPVSGDAGNNTTTTDGAGLVCRCAKILDPVCGRDGVSYNNPCLASCAGAEVAYIGSCADPAGCAAVSCTADYDPVCGADNVTYSNDCVASCTGVTIVAQGECGASGTALPSPGGNGTGNGNGNGAGDSSCACTEEWAPVCGKDGKTYGNKCAARCAKAAVAYSGNCEDPDGCNAVRCMTQVDPVCGANGKQYQNECFAACTGVSFTRGSCEAPASGASPAASGARPPPRKILSKPPSKKLHRPPPHSRPSSNSASSNKPSPSPSPSPSPAARKVAASACQQCQQGPLELQPVCGTDGITYGSACLAWCSGVSIVAERECARRP